MSAAQFDPDYLKTMPIEDVLAVALSLTLHQHVPGWPGATDEQLNKVANDLLGCLASHGYVFRKVSREEILAALEARKSK